MPDKPIILIADDDVKIAQAVGLRLQAAGYEVHRVHDGISALEATHAHNPHALVLDLRMPGMDGFSVLARLREIDETQDIPVIVLSASAVDERRALDAGAYCFLPKPYDPQTLLRSISSALESTDPVLH